MKQEHIRSIPITGGVITVSSTRTEETDSSGKTIKAILAEAEIPIVYYVVVTDRIKDIRSELLPSPSKPATASSSMVVPG